jgi:hypothetical protein
MEVYIRQDTVDMCEELNGIMETEGFASTKKYNEMIKDLAFALCAAVELKES